MYIANKFKQQTQNVSLKSVILACAVFFLLVPGFIPLHELTHYYCAKAHGWDAKIYSVVTHYRQIDPEIMNGSVMRMRCAAVGPAFDLAVSLTGAGIFLFLMKGKSIALSESFWFWFASICCVKGLRWFRIVWQGHGDEAAVSVSLGLERMFVAKLLLPVSIGFLLLLLWVHWRTKTTVQFFAAYCAGVIGVGLWIDIVGPAIFGG